MEILDRLVLAPAAGHVPLLGFLILLALLVLMPFLGVLIVSAAASLFLRRERPAVARELIDLGVANPAAWIVFGLLPLLVLAFLYQQYLFETRAPVGAYILRLLALCVPGFALLFVYRRTLHPAAGVPGLLLTLGVAFHLISSLDLVAYPEKWSFIDAPLPFLHSIQVVIHFLLFLAVGAAFAGGALLLAAFQWPERRPPGTDANRSLVRGLGLGLLLAGSLAAPLLVLWDLYSAPGPALAPEVFVLAGLLLVVLLVAAMLAVAMLRGHHARYASLAFLLTLAAFGLLVGKGRSLQSLAIREHETLLARRAAERHEELVAQREEGRAAARPADETLGERIFNERCSACHSFERRVVGPPYNEVLPRYAGNLDALIEFVRNPKRVNPVYPPMPDQGLRASQVRAVSAYLLHRFTGESPEDEGQAGGEPAAGAPGEEPGKNRESEKSREPETSEEPEKRRESRESES